MNYKNINDYEVMYMVRENNEDAVNVLFEKYKPLIYKIALRYYERVKRCGIDFDDMFQEGMIALNSAICNYNENSKATLYTYILVCVERHFITYCRNISNGKHMILNSSVRDEDYYLNISMDDDLYFGYRIDAFSEFTKIKNEFEFFDGNIFELRYNGFSYKEICTLLDIPYSLLESRMSKIRTLLRKKEKTFI